MKPGENPETATEQVRGVYNMSYEQFAQMAIVGTPDQVVEILQARKEAGVNYFIFYLSRLAYDHEQLHRVAEEVIPRLQ